MLKKDRGCGATFPQAFSAVHCSLVRGCCAARSNFPSNRPRRFLLSLLCDIWKLRIFLGLRVFPPGFLWRLVVVPLTLLVDPSTSYHFLFDLSNHVPLFLIAWEEFAYWRPWVSQQTKSSGPASFVGVFGPNISPVAGALLQPILALWSPPMMKVHCGSFSDEVFKIMAILV